MDGYSNNTKQIQTHPIKPNRSNKSLILRFAFINVVFILTLVLIIADIRVVLFALLYSFGACYAILVLQWRFGACFVNSCLYVYQSRI